MDIEQLKCVCENTTDREAANRCRIEGRELTATSEEELKAYTAQSS